MRIKAAWHMSHRMPDRASLDRGVKWHLLHAKVCGCRAVPRTVVKELQRRGMKVPSRR